MSAALAINPAIITPLTQPPGSVNRPAVINSAAPSWPTYSNTLFSQFSPPAVAPVNQPSPLSVSGIPPTALPDIQAVAPAPILPDINQMETQLKMTGSLLSEIPVQPESVSKPLEHLQPNTIQFPQPTTAEITSPTLAEPTANVPINPIKLASTAPGATIPVSAEQNENSTFALPQNISRKMIMTVIGLLTLATIAVLGIVMMQEYQLTTVLPLITS